MMKKILLPTIFLTLGNYATANMPEKADHIKQRFDDQRLQAKQVEPPLSQAVNQPAKTVKSPPNETISITKEELAKNPDLVVRALLPAVMQGNMENVDLLYPIYKTLPENYQDSLLTLWAKAILSKKSGNYVQSITQYRQILAQNSTILAVRLQLAITLFENNELEAAEDQFHKLRSESLPNGLQAVISQYLSAIQKQNSWTFNGGLTYLNDPNINNAPKSGTTYGRWHAPKRESAQGVGFNLNVGKKWAWGNGFFNELRANGYGKYYWNNKKYNEITGRISTGIGFQNAQYSINLLPFMEQMLYAGGSSKSESLKRFSKTAGATLESHYWLSPKWQLNAVYEYGEQRYTTRKHLNGNYHFISVGINYLANAKQYYFANMNYQRTSARDKDDAYFRRGIQLGWGQEWGKGFSSRLSLSYAQKRYKAPMFFGMTQRNNEYGMQASLWHRAIHFWGITPRLTYHYTKTKSNHVFYSYDKQRVFLDFSKQF